MLKQQGENIVIISASGLNPSIFSEKWFIQNSILKADEIIDGKTVTTSNLSIIHSTDFYIQFFNNQFVVFLEKFDSQELRNRVIEVVKKVVLSNVLGTIPVIGLNFHYISPDLNNMEEVTEKLHNAKESKFYTSVFSNEKRDKNMRYGSYTSLDFCDSRLRVDIKPHYSLTMQNFETLNASYNYSKKLSLENVKEEVEAFLLNYMKFKENSENSVVQINSLI